MLDFSGNVTILARKNGTDDPYRVVGRGHNKITAAGLEAIRDQLIGADGAVALGTNTRLVVTYDSPTKTKFLANPRTGDANAADPAQRPWPQLPDPIFAAAAAWSATRTYQASAVVYIGTGVARLWYEALRENINVQPSGTSDTADWKHLPTGTGPSLPTGQSESDRSLLYVFEYTHPADSEAMPLPTFSMHAAANGPTWFEADGADFIPPLDEINPDTQYIIHWEVIHHLTTSVTDSNVRQTLVTHAATDLNFSGVGILPELLSVKGRQAVLYRLANVAPNPGNTGSHNSLDPKPVIEAQAALGAFKYFKYQLIRPTNAASIASGQKQRIADLHSSVTIGNDGSPFYGTAAANPDDGHVIDVTATIPAITGSLLAGETVRWYLAYLARSTSETDSFLIDVAPLRAPDGEDDALTQFIWPRRVATPGRSMKYMLFSGPDPDSPCAGRSALDITGLPTTVQDLAPGAHVVDFAVSVPDGWAASMPAVSSVAHSDDGPITLSAVSDRGSGNYRFTVTVAADAPDDEYATVNVAVVAQKSGCPQAQRGRSFRIQFNNP